MMEKFKRGCSVELLGFGTIFPTIKGSISETDTPGKIKKQFDVGFTPSENARNALKNLTVFRVRRPSVQHIIFSIVNIFKPEEKNLLEPGCIARMTGKAIKLGGEKSGIYAALVTENWNGKLPARENWIQMNHVTQNKPSTLEFYAEGLSQGFYVFIVETSLSAGGKELKNSVIIHSNVAGIGVNADFLKLMILLLSFRQTPLWRKRVQHDRSFVIPNLIRNVILSLPKNLTYRSLRPSVGC